MVGYLLPHKVKISLRQFHIDLFHGFWLIGHLIQIFTTPGTCSSSIIYFFHFLCDSPRQKINNKSTAADYLVRGSVTSKP